MLLEQEQQQKLSDIKNLVTGTIRVGGTHYLNAYILPDILADFMNKYPGVEFQIMERSSHVLLEMLYEKELDITFNCSPEFIQNFPYYEMFEDHILLVVPVNHPVHSRYSKFALTTADILNGRHLDKHCPKLPINFFSDLEFILLRKGNNLHERAWAMFHEAGFEPKVKLDLNQLVTAYHLAEAGIGATFVSDKIVRPQDTSLIYYPLDSTLATRMFYILLPRNVYIPIAVQKFIEHIQNWQKP